MNRGVRLGEDWLLSVSRAVFGVTTAPAEDEGGPPDQGVWGGVG